MVPNGPPAIPIPGVSKSLLPGGEQIGKKMFFIILYDSYEKGKKHPFVRYCLMFKGVLTKTIVTVFPRVSKNRKSNNYDKHVTARRKGGKCPIRNLGT